MFFKNNKREKKRREELLGAFTACPKSSLLLRSVGSMDWYVGPGENVNQSFISLLDFRSLFVWIAGGYREPGNLEYLESIIGSKVEVENLIVFGSPGLSFDRSFKNRVRMRIKVDTLEDAVNMAKHLAIEKAGSLERKRVLFSSVCSSGWGNQSFKDQFFYHINRNY